MPPTVENNGIDRREGGDEEENVREREMEWKNEREEEERQK
jgi:hypothetical protein